MGTMHCRQVCDAARRSRQWWAILQITNEEMFRNSEGLIGGKYDVTNRMNNTTEYKFKLPANDSELVSWIAFASFRVPAAN